MYNFAKDVTPTVAKFTLTNAQGQSLVRVDTNSYVVNADGSRTLILAPGSANVQYSQFEVNGQPPGPPLVGNSTTMYSINDRGSVTGHYTDANGGIHGWVYDNGTYRTVDVPGSTATWVQGIANDGTIMGSYRDAATGFEKQFQATPHPF